MCAAGPSCQVTASLSRPCIAAQVLVATTATPLEIFTTSSTPATLRAAPSSTLAIVPPKVGALSTLAYTIPGTLTSIPYCAVPRDFASTSRRLGEVPIRKKRPGSLSGTCLGTGIVPASTASSPYDRLRFEPAWCTAPSLVVHSDAGTFQRLAAAATSIARAAAPAPRSSGYITAMLVLPPVVMSLNTGSAYWFSAGAISTRMRSQGRSSSSATSIGKPV